MRVGKRSICGIMAGILFMMEPVSGYGMMREGTWKKDIRNQIMEIQQMQPELTPYTGPEITAPSAILMEASTGTVICEKNADEPRNPASVTKIMTLILIFDALESGKLSGAGLDVYEEETEFFFEDRSEMVKRDTLLSLLVSMPNVVLTSHQAFLTNEALHNIAQVTLENLDAYFQDGTILNQVQ